ncbi:MAG: DUF5724 domain-containing protein [Chloroflexota bacterium]
MFKIAALEEYYLDNWQQHRAAQVDALPLETRTLAYELLAYNPTIADKEQHGEWLDAIAQHKNESGEKLATLSSHERQQLFATLLPKLAIELEAGWRVVAKRPYLSRFGSAGSRPFCSSNDASIHARYQWDWLCDIVQTIGPFEQDMHWLLEVLNHFNSWNMGPLHHLLAAAIEIGNDLSETIFQTMLAAARNQSNDMAFGTHVIRPLLMVERIEGWEAIERLLLAAQREEGLRQSILHEVRFAHPQAFQRIVSLIAEHDLLRFSSVLYSFNHWFRLNFDVTTRKKAEAYLTRVDQFLRDPAAVQAALHGDEPEACYLALCVVAFENVEYALAVVEELKGHSNATHRFMAAYFLANSGTWPFDHLLMPFLRDDDPLVAATALAHFSRRYYQTNPPELRSICVEVIDRFPLKAEKYTSLWSWHTPEAGQSIVADVMASATTMEMLPTLFPYIDRMGTNGRQRVIGLMPEARPLSAEEFAVVTKLLGDRSSSVRDTVKGLLEVQTFTAEQIVAFEKYFSRKTESLRKAILQVILRQPDEVVFLSVDRLLAKRKELERRAGLELLAALVQQERAITACQQRAQSYQESTENLNTYQQQLIENVLQAEQAQLTLVDGLGLFNPADRTPPQIPQAYPERFDPNQPRTVPLIESLQTLIDDNAERTVVVEHEWGTSEYVLGNLNYGLYFGRWQDDGTIPFNDLWLSWWENQQHVISTEPEPTDADFVLLQLWASYYEQGHHFYTTARLKDTIEEPPEALVNQIRAILYGRADAGVAQWRYSGVMRTVQQWLATPYGRVDVKAIQWKYPGLMRDVLQWLVMRYATTPEAIDKLLDALEHSLYLMNEVDAQSTGAWYITGGLHGWFQAAHFHFQSCYAQWNDAQICRYWRLYRWYDEPGIDGFARQRPQMDLVISAYHAGGATEADIMDQLIGERLNPENSYSFSDLGEFSPRNPSQRQRHPNHRHRFAEDPVLQAAVQRCRERTLSIECARGEIETPATGAARALRYAGGAEAFCQTLHALSNSEIKRSRDPYNEQTGRAGVLAHLLKVTMPNEGETPTVVLPMLAKLTLSDKQWIEAAVFAPQWTAHIEARLQWPDFAEAVWWFHAHTKDHRWSIEQSIKDAWAAQISQRTPLTSEQLLDGAVDVGWFHRAYHALGDDRWQQVHSAAKFASSGAGHTRAKLFADAMLGRVDENALRKRINDKRHQDSVRTLGLLPLPTGDTSDTREPVVLERYLLSQDFLKTGRKFGAQRKASEKLAVEIGLKNLARTAGYPDPLQLQWAMERYAVQDLAEGPITVAVETKSGETSVSLHIDALGEPQLEVMKKGRMLKSIPKAVKKDPDVATLVQRKKEISEQTSRMRLSLEQSMCRGDAFAWADLRIFLEHPVLRPMLEELLFVVDGQAEGKASLQIGCFRQGESTLYDVNGEPITLTTNDKLRLAHPHDLFVADEWHLWQRICFEQERIQPFKQVFRELYVVTPAEREAEIHSQRYAGQQVHTRQSMALLGQQQWSTSHYEGGVQRTFHNEGITVWLNLDGGWYTSAEVEGMTLDTVNFTKRGEWVDIKLEDVPPRLFSEVMRDLDLVVSVAHQGGVDPESTASTKEIRASLVRETARLMKLDNVRIADSGSHVFIDGSVSNYSVHLSSGVVHQRPGNYVCIVPVHAQHRGRLFLPFVDDDPKSAEIMSKVVMLARDGEIKDPSILEQIRQRG